MSEHDEIVRAVTELRRQFDEERTLNRTLVADLQRRVENIERKLCGTKERLAESSAKIVVWPEGESSDA